MIVRANLKERKGIDVDESFENFVVTEGTATAVAACKAIAKGEPSFLDQRLYLVGPAGCGKTHLLRALQASLESRCKVEYLTDEQLTNIFIQKAAYHDWGQWDKILNADYVLVDDFGSFGRHAYLASLKADLQPGPRLIIAMTPYVRDGDDPEDVFARLPGTICYLQEPSMAELVDIAKHRIANHDPVPPFHKLVAFATEAQGDPRKMFGAIRSWQFAEQLELPPPPRALPKPVLQDRPPSSAVHSRRMFPEKEERLGTDLASTPTQVLDAAPAARATEGHSPYACRECGKAEASHGWFRPGHQFRAYSKNEPCALCGVSLEVHAFADALTYEVHAWVPGDTPLDESDPHYEARMPRNVNEVFHQQRFRQRRPRPTPGLLSTTSDPQEAFEDGWSALRSYEATHRTTTYALVTGKPLPVEPIRRFGRVPDAPNILWLDDDEAVLRTGCAWLQEKGYRGTGVTHGELARAALQSESFDVFIGDFRNHGSDTYLLFQQAMRRSTKLLLCTEGIDVSIAENFLRLGATILRKAFLLEDLREVLDQHH